MATVTENLGSWIRQFHPRDGAGVRLVCFPHAGGSATFFFPVSRALAPDVDVLAVQYPGRQDRRDEPCVDDLERLADMAVEALRPWCDRPVAMFGHSMGATVAYEVCRRLESEGIAPLGLFASGRRAPSIHHVETIHLRDDKGIVAALKDLSGTEAAVLGDEELLNMVLPAVRGDYKAVETYRHRGGQELNCPICVLVGDNDPMTPVVEARGWRAHTTGQCRVEVFPGGHFYLKPQAANVLQTISRQLRDWSH